MTTDNGASQPITWSDIPPQWWPEATEPTSEDLADWLTGMSREHLVWVLDKQRQAWRRDSDCFMRDHEGQIRRAEERLLGVMTVLQLHGIVVDSPTPNAPSQPGDEGSSS